MALAEALREAAKTLENCGVSTPRLDAEVLLAFSLGISRDALLLKNPDPSKGQLLHFQNCIRRRAAREPVARITGTQEFWSLAFKVNEATLVPRPDSETLVETALNKTPADKPVRILDLGTGSGCLLLSILSERPLATGVGVDVSDKALECATENAARLGLADRAAFAKFDWMNADQTPGQFDMVISNPPYIPGPDIKDLEPEVARFEPARALDGGPDGLLPYRVLIPLTRGLLSGRGWVLFEIGEGQETLVRNLLSEVNYTNLETAYDLAGNPRVVAGFCPFGPG